MSNGAEYPNGCSVPPPEGAQLTSSRPRACDKLPFDLLAAIFVLWTQLDEDAPWMAAAVNKHWRNVVLTTSEAWSWITVRLEPEQKLDDEWCIEEDDIERALSPRNKRRPIALWTERAIGSPLSLHMVVHPAYPKLGLATGEIVLALSSHIQLLRRLTFTVESGYFATSVLEALAEIAGDYTLDHLEIDVVENRAPKHLRFNAEGLVLDLNWYIAPAAKHLVFRGCLPPPRNTPAHHVRSLTLENASASFTALLPSVPDIRYLELTCGPPSGPPSLLPPEPLKMVSLSFLTELNIHGVPTGHAAKLLDALHTTALTRLTLGHLGAAELRVLWAAQEDAKWYDLMDVYGASLAAFAERTPSLEVVRFVRSPIDDRHFLHVLSSLIGLHTLELDTLLIGLPALRGLTPPVPGAIKPGGKSTPVLCPRLQLLRITKCESIKSQHLAALLRARNCPGAQCLPILCLDVIDCKGVAADDAESLSTFDPDRLKITIL